MDPISKDQELTLRNWVNTFGKPPGRLEKMFLQTEKGLSECQIELWLNKHRDLHAQNIQLPQQPNRDSIGPLRQRPSQSYHSSADRCGVYFLNDFSFSNLADDSLDLLDLSVQEPRTWSPIDPSNGFFDANVMEVLEKNHPWSAMDCISESPTHFGPPCLPETRHLLSKPHGSHSTRRNDSDRSSCVSNGSSTQSGNTAPSLTSSPDLSADDLADPEILQRDLTKNQSQRSKRGSRMPARWLSNDIVPKEICSGQCHKSEFTILPAEQEASKCKKQTSSQGPNDPLKIEKGQPKYICTVCNFAFSRKGDWERHEDSKHDPQVYWTCMLGDPAVQTPDGWSCAFCNTSKSKRDEILEHLKLHKINHCTHKPHANRTWTRKDKLKRHLQQVHSLSESSNHWEQWQRPASRKGAWGCGFCGACSFTWEGRLIHIADHYESQSHHISQWSLSMVLKGLLKQCQKNFNIARAWKEIVDKDPNSDQLFEWSKEDAAILKRKLEFHEGTPRDLAAEARRLAKTSFLAVEHPSWTSSESKETNLMEPSMWRNWPGDSILGMPSFPSSNKPSEVEMANCI